MTVGYRGGQRPGGALRRRAGQDGDGIAGYDGRGREDWSCREDHHAHLRFVNVSLRLETICLVGTAEDGLAIT